MFEKSRFIAREHQHLSIKEKVFSLSGDSFSIKNVKGDVVFWMDGSILSFSGRKYVRDAKGNYFFDIRKKLLAFHTAFNCENLQGQTFFKVKRQFSIRKF
jgi:uncharacterized protein YxjI